MLFWVFTSLAFIAAIMPASQTEARAIAAALAAGGRPAVTAKTTLLRACTTATAGAGAAFGLAVPLTVTFLATDMAVTAIRSAMMKTAPAVVAIATECTAAISVNAAVSTAGALAAAESATVASARPIVATRTV